MTSSVWWRLKDSFLSYNSENNSIYETWISFYDRIVLMTQKTISQKEAEAILHKEGFQRTYVWSDGPGTYYPEHTHPTVTAHIILDGNFFYFRFFESCVLFIVLTDGSQERWTWQCKAKHIIWKLEIVVTCQPTQSIQQRWALKVVLISLVNRIKHHWENKHFVATFEKLQFQKNLFSERRMYFLYWWVCLSYCSNG